MSLGWFKVSEPVRTTVQHRKQGLWVFSCASVCNIYQPLSGTSIQLLPLEVLVKTPRLSTKVLASKLSGCREPLLPLSPTSMQLLLLTVWVKHFQFIDESLSEQSEWPSGILQLLSSTSIRLLQLEVLVEVCLLLKV